MVTRSAIVVGAGIVGTSTAWALHGRGWVVTLLDAGPVPNPDGSSGGVHRLIRSTYGAERGYTAMIAEAYDAWDDVWATLGRTLMAHTGMLVLDAPGGGTYGADSAAVADDLGLPYVRFDDMDEVRARWPQFRIPAGATAIHQEQAHFLRAREIVGAMTGWLADHGVTVRPHTAATGVDLDAGIVALQDGERLTADRVVVAAGPWTTRLTGVDAPPLTPSRQVVVDLAVPDDLRAAWDTGPAFLIQPAYGVPPREGLPLKVGDHHFSMAGDPDEDRTPRPDEVAAVLDVAGEALVDIHRYELLEARACLYTVHDEERFVVAPRGARGALCAGFSGHGFKFGPVIGRGVAAALDGDTPWDVVTPWAAGGVDT